MKNARWRIEFIFGTSTYRMVNIANNLFQELPIHSGEPPTEENFERIFAEICEAMRMAGLAHEGDGIDCVTFPEGSQRADSKGNA
jgi:hypothetical protein